ncbi:MAG: hypothetical protein HYV09_30185 [Deltaproteobacteria bacterium]|nr:hypothetical protein [Deltaproteobacteria bacterium]
MRPERPRESTARVKSQLRAHLDFLHGVPLAVDDGAISWLVLPAGEVVRVDGTTLSGATRCVRELLREPALLARVVGDTDRWKARVLSAIERLKPALHRDAPLDDAVADLVGALPSGAARRARKALGDPRTRAIAARVLWAHALEPEVVPAALAALDDHWALLASMSDAPVACHALLRIAREDGPRAGALFAWLEEATETGAPRCDRRAFVDAFPLSVEPASSPVSVRAPHPAPKQQLTALPKLATWLGQQDARTRRAALSLVTASAPLGRLREWTVAWEELASLDAAARRRKEWRPDAPIIGKLRALKDRLPPPCDLEAFVGAVRVLSDSRWSEVVDPLVRTLAVVPAPARARYLEYWAEIVRDADEPARRRIPAYLAAFRGWAATATELAPWRVLSELDHPVRTWASPDEGLIVSLRGDGVLQRFFATLAAAQTRDIDLLETVVTSSRGEPRLLAERADALSKHDLPPSRLKHALRLADALGPTTTEEWVTLVVALATRAAAALDRAWSNAPLDDAVRACMRRTFVASPHVIAGVSLMVAIADEVPPPIRASGDLPRWAARYPEPLHRALARVTEDVARKLLDDDFPADESLKRQIRALEARADATPAMRRRIETLRARIGVERELSARRLSNLAGKLEQAADRAWFGEWSGRLREACARTIERLLGSCPSWALEDHNLAALHAALELEPEGRDLALRLFRLRTGPRPWDLSEAPENVAFVRGLRARGIDPRPWIDGIGVIERAGPDGATCLLSLEDDPLEIFQMGERFGTCLSVGSSNYFSVFANAADIDKRVAYGRDAEGKVLARCLLALTDDGHVLTFHAYAHQHSEVFARLFGELAAMLAEKMGTVCAPSGRVRARVAKNWYDDGPIDLAGQFPFLHDERSRLRRSMREIEPAEVVRLAAEAFEPRPLDALTIPLVLSLPEVDARPELALPLVALLTDPARGEGGPLSESLRLRAAELAHRAGDLARARALAGDLVAAELEAGLTSEDGHQNPRLLAMQLDFDPASVLAIARRVSKRTRGTWMDQRRRLAAAMALERLGRLRRALEVLRTPARLELREAEELARRIEGKLRG